MNEGRITGQQWKALIAAWLGWAFDGLDGYLYVLVALKFVRELMPGATDVQVQEKAGLIQGVFLVGWAIGGLVFGRIGDRLGRTKTLTLTVLTYAVFTGLSYFAAAWWHLLVFRFVAALGIGGEWAAGSALVSEMLHKRHRAWASAGLQSGYMVGMLLAIATVRWFDSMSARNVFLIGVVPALFTVWIRWAVPEPAEWKHAKERAAMPPMSALFAPGLRRVTLLLVSMAGIALTTVWAFLYFGPQIVQRLPEVQSWTPKERADFVMWATVAYTVVNIGANFCACYVARVIGYRRAFVVWMAGSLGAFGLFWWQPTVWTVIPVLCAGAFFSLGLFGMFPLYIPPQFPTLVRTLGAGFTYNMGRVIAGVGAYFGAAIAANAGGAHKAVFWTGLLYVLGVAVAWVVPEIPEAPARSRRCPSCDYDMEGLAERAQCPECGGGVPAV